MVRSANFPIFRKNQGQFQFKYLGPKIEPMRNTKAGAEIVQSTGSVMIDAAPTLSDGENCDWNQKITFKLAITDFVVLLPGLRSLLEDEKPPEVKIIHASKKKIDNKEIDFTRVLSFTRNNQYFNVRLSESSSLGKKDVKVGASEGEIMVLDQLLRNVCHTMLGWTDDANTYKDNA